MTSTAPTFTTPAAPHVDVQPGVGHATYGDAWPVRDNLAATHLWTVSQWAQPGTWLTGEQRLDVVRAVRAARAADPTPPPWAKPSGDALTDAIWRLTNHPGSLTQQWHAQLIEGGVDPLAYVEVVGLVAQANNVDRFADALGLRRLELPEAVPGEPSRAVPDGVGVTTHWVPTADVEFAYVLKALTAVPPEVDAWLALSHVGYVPIEWVRGELVSDYNSLTRPQIELVAARTSKLNECFY